MSVFLCIVLFAAFAVVQLLLTQKATHKVIRYIPLILSTAVTVFAVGLHIYARITYEMGMASESVLAENQYFAMFICIPALICLVGSIVGLMIGKARK